MYRQHDNLGLRADISVATFTMSQQQDIWTLTVIQAYSGVIGCDEKLASVRGQELHPCYLLPCLLPTPLVLHVCSAGSSYFESCNLQLGLAHRRHMPECTNVPVGTNRAIGTSRATSTNIVWQIQCNCQGN